uniref:Gonadotropin releasing hormone receptor 1 n=1 Tax=Amphiprion percula TaxID=161767 RepID=A0A3P8SJW0_AMPPE
QNGSVSVYPASPSSPLWEVPSFTVAANCHVAAILVLFVFATVCWGWGYRLAKHLRPLIISLSSADLLMTVVVLPLDAIWNITVQWYAGDIMCKLLCFLKLFAMDSAAFILVVVSLDRYWAILHPLDSLDAGLRNRRMLLVAWTLSLLLASPQLFIFRAVKADGVDFTQCETAYNMFHFVTLYVFPLACHDFLLHPHPHQINAKTHKSKVVGTDMIPKARMKTLKMTIVIVSSFVICWTPYYLLGIWYWFQPGIIQHTPQYVHHILFVFGNLSTCCDPVIYGFYTVSFRADLADVVNCCCSHRSNNEVCFGHTVKYHPET